MPYRQQIEEILARWREVERLLARAPEGSDEAADLEAEAAELRDQLRVLTARQEQVAGREPDEGAELGGLTT